MKKMVDYIQSKMNETQYDPSMCAKVATQIVYDYPEWGPEHVGDMIDTYDQKQPAPFTYDQLLDVADYVDSLKRKGTDAEAAIADAIEFAKTVKETKDRENGSI